MGKEQPRLEAEHPANTAKNRYPHVLPCECGWAAGWGPEEGPREPPLTEGFYPLQMTTPGSG